MCSLICGDLNNTHHSEEMSCAKGNFRASPCVTWGVAVSCVATGATGRLMSGTAVQPYKTANEQNNSGIFMRAIN
jgi:hypothetical protein